MLAGNRNRSIYANDGDSIERRKGGELRTRRKAKRGEEDESIDEVDGSSLGVDGWGRIVIQIGIVSRLHAGDRCMGTTTTSIGRPAGR